MKISLHPLGKTLCIAGVAAGAVLSANIASADTILGIYGGVGTWTTNIDGSLGIDDEPITTNELGMSADDSVFFYIALEHPIPLIPNIKLHHSSLKSNGQAVVEREFTWDEITFPADTDTTTVIDFTQTDVTLYYEILDNWVSLDVGLTAKVLDGTAYAFAEQDGLDPIEETVELTGALPLLYGMARIDLPLTGAYVAGHINYISYDNSTISDIDVKVGWLFESVLDVGAELGYKQLKLELSDFEDSNADLTFDGPYLNLALHF